MNSKTDIVKTVIGLILLISGFLTFPSIALLNSGNGITSTTHWIIVGIGLLLIIISIVIFYFVTKDRASI